MLKKLSILILAVLVVGFCVTIIPEGKVDASAISCSGSHKHKSESGTASCSGQVGQNTSKSFKTSSPWWGTPKYSALLSNLISDYYTVKVKGACGASASKSNVKAVGYTTTKITINY